MVSKRTVRPALAALVALGATALGLAAAGCRGTGTMVLAPPSEPARFTSVSLERSTIATWRRSRTRTRSRTGSSS